MRSKLLRVLALCFLMVAVTGVGVVPDAQAFCCDSGPAPKCPPPGCG